MRRRLASVEVLITSWGCPPIDAEVLAAAPNLRAALHAAGSVRSHVGHEVFDRDILVTTAAHVNAEPVAQYTVAAILWAFKKVPFHTGVMATPSLAIQRFAVANSATFAAASSVIALSKPRLAASTSARCMFGYKQLALASVGAASRAGRR